MLISHAHAELSTLSNQPSFNMNNSDSSMPSNSSRTQLQSINEGAASGSASASVSFDQHRKHKPTNVSPSQLNAGNLHQFPKDMMRIHNRDSGIARHPSFCCVVRCFEEQRMLNGRISSLKL